MTTEQAVGVLNGLIRVCLDSANGFHSAAEAARSFDLKQALESFAEARRRFATELGAEVERLGQPPAEAGSFAGMLEHGWFRLKSLVAGLDVGDVVSECEHGESVAIQSYEAALTLELPSEIHNVVERQLDIMRETSTRLRSAETACARA